MEITNSMEKIKESSKARKKVYKSAPRKVGGVNSPSIQLIIYCVLMWEAFLSC